MILAYVAILLIKKKLRGSEFRKYELIPEGKEWSVKREKGKFRT